MHIVNSCANNIQHTEINKQSAWSSLNSQIISVENTARWSHCGALLIFKERSFQVHLKNETTYFHMYISVSEFVIPLCHYVVGYKLLNLAPVKKCKILQFMATSPYYNLTTCTSFESPRNIKFSTVSHLTRNLQIKSQISMWIPKKHVLHDSITSLNHKEEIHKSDHKSVLG